MSWTDAEVDELIASVRRDFALGRMNPKFRIKLQGRGISALLAEKAVSKKSYIVEFDHHGPTIGFLDSTTKIFVAWKSTYPSELKTCFVANGGLQYLKRQYEFQLIWKPK